MINLENLLVKRNNIKDLNPLIHCITNPISINNCANIILSTGASPIMAEHPLEVSEITTSSNALLLNLGNITDQRMDSMEISAAIANKNNIPIVLDLVGVSCSFLRLTFAKKLLDNYKFNIIKGNMSEIKSIYLNEKSSIGIDVSNEDKINVNNLENYIYISKSLSNKYNSTILISGKIDIITDKNISYTNENGVEELSNITGTGCMLGALCASFLSSYNSFESAILATLLLNISGEVSSFSKGPGSFLLHLMDNIYSLDNLEIIKKAKLLEYKEDNYV